MKKDLAKLSVLEECIYRMRNGKEINDDILLSKKTENKEILSLLLKIEKEIFYRAMLRKKS